MSVKSLVAKPAEAFAPDYAIPPGETVREVMESLELTQSELAERTGRPKKTINEIIKGKAAITYETALQFERVLGVAASFWSNLEHNYQAALARKAERERLAKQIKLLEVIPVPAMMKAGWIEKRSEPVAKLEAVLSFFGVASAEAWQNIWGGYRTVVAFRQATEIQSDFGSVAAWLRKAELKARSVPTKPYNAKRFKAMLSEIRAMTYEDREVFQPNLVAKCADAGVVVVFVRELPAIRVCGATRWLTPDKALISLTLRYKTDDQIWFTFFHEAAHILLHGKRDVFLEGVKGGSHVSIAGRAPTTAESEKQEEEANRFSRDFLIPPDAYERFVDEGVFTDHMITAFAADIGVSPGVVVGRLQHDDKVVWQSSLNHLKKHFSWADAD